MKLFQPTRSKIDASILECKNLFFETDSSGTIEVIVERDEVYYTKKEMNIIHLQLNLIMKIFMRIFHLIAKIQLIYKWKFKFNNDIMFGEMGLSASKFNNEFLDLELVSIVSNGNPETNKIYYPTYKNKPILINDYKSFFKSQYFTGINIVWFNEKIKDNYLLSDYRLENLMKKVFILNKK